MLLFGRIASYFLILFFFYSCSPNKPSGKSIVGRVILKDATDFSGVKVLLYNPTSVDTSISNPAVKFNLFNQDLTVYLFDHRGRKPFAQTFTDKDGNFRFNDVPEGEYVLFVQKEGYGWKFFKISASSDAKTFTLEKERVIFGVMSDKDTLRENVVIKGDVLIPSGSTVYIKDGAVLKFDGYYKFIVEGNLIGENFDFNVPIIFTSEDTSVYFDGVYVRNGGCVKIKNAIFRSANVGLSVDGSDCEVGYSAFIGNKSYGISATRISSGRYIKVYNCIFAGKVYDFGVGQPIGVNFEFTDTNASVVNSIFYLNSESGVYCTTSGARIEGNYFSGNGHSIEIWSNVNRDTLLVKNNEFLHSRNYHVLHRGGIAKYLYNNIYSTAGGVSLSPTSGRPVALINFNNLTGKRYLLALGSWTSNTDARFNYWGTASEAEIRNLIFDRNDVSPSDPNYNLYGVVDYSGFLSSPVPNAGIRR